MMDTPQPASNQRTVMRPAVRFVAPTPRAAFEAAWPVVRPLLGSGGKYVLTVVDGRRRAPSAISVSPAPGEVRDLVVGRHTRADLRIDGDGCVALRQTLVRVSGGTVGEGLARVRFVDLCTEDGLHDENDRWTRGLISDGHLFARFGECWLLAIRDTWPTVPVRASDAWDGLADRCFVHPQPAALEGRQLRIRPRLGLAGGGEDSTRVTHVSGTVRLPLPGVDTSAAIGALIVEDSEGTGRCARVSSDALASGVLLGRYDRCHLGSSALGNDRHLSRVHLCVILDEDGLWAVDLASTNGSRLDGERFRTAKLGRQAKLSLPGHLTVRWTAA